MIKTLWLVVASASMLMTDNLAAVVSYYASHDSNEESQAPDQSEKGSAPRPGRNSPYRVTIQGEREEERNSDEDEDVNDNEDPEDDDLDEAKGSDGQIARNVNNILKSSFKDYNINVHVSNGIVRLNGMVRSDDDKKAIEKEVRNIDGVKSINSQLEIGKRAANSAK